MRDHHRIFLQQFNCAQIDGHFKYGLASDALINSDVKAGVKGYEMAETGMMFACSTHVKTIYVYIRQALLG